MSTQPRPRRSLRPFELRFAFALAAVGAIGWSTLGFVCLRQAVWEYQAVGFLIDHTRPFHAPRAATDPQPAAFATASAHAHHHGHPNSMTVCLPNAGLVEIDWKR